MKLKKVIAFALVAAMFAGLWSVPTASATPVTRTEETAGLISLKNAPEKEKPYTLMVYMVGSNLESVGGYASSDIKEMLDSGLKGENANLLVCTGGAVSWELDIPSDTNTVYALNGVGDDLEPVARTSRSENMGRPETLADFLNFARKYYPGEKYGIIFWDHGGGPLYGFGNDELHDNDSLTISELTFALSQGGFGEEKLEFVGFDACLMASVEVAAALSDYARYLVASEEVESGTGWAYGFLKTLNDTGDTGTLIRAILSGYQNAMETNLWKPDYTLSCVDLSKIPELTLALDGVWEALSASIQNGDYTAIARNRNETKRFGISAVSDRGNSYDLVDLESMLTTLTEWDTTQALACLRQAVTVQVSNVENAGGLSIYYPYDNRNLYKLAERLSALPSLSESHRSYLTKFADAWLSGETGVYLTPEQKLRAQEEELVLELAANQLEVLGSAEYAVLQYDPDTGAYGPLLTGMNIMPDGDGCLHIPRNPNVFMMYTDREGNEGMLWPVTLVEAGMRKNRYISRETTLFASMDMIVGGTEPIQIALSETLSNGRVEIQSILSRSWSDTEFYGRQDVDIQNWGWISYNWNSMYPTSDTEGNLLPWANWETESRLRFFLCNYEENFWLQTRQLQDLEGQFYCQVTLKDTSGNVIGARLEELYTNTPYKDQKVIVEGGTLTYRIYKDHAEVLSFEEKDDGSWLTNADYTITIPERIAGVPVTVIGERAFANTSDVGQVVLPKTIETIQFRAFFKSRNLTKINLPEGLKSLGAGALYNTPLTRVILPESLETLGYQSLSATKITEITIPAGVKQVGAGSFAYCNALERIDVAEGNTAYRSQNGVLFTHDGSELVAFPGAFGESYTIPAGTEVLKDEAMRGNTMLTRLNFNRDLRVIDRLALCDVSGLLYVNLPESLETIGTAAFGDSSWAAPTVRLPVMKIGSRVSYIGSEAFTGYKIGAFEVVQGNQWYSSENGCLLNASGTRLLDAPSGQEGTLAIPEGVNYLTWYSLYYCDEVTELILPDSLVGISHAAGVPELLQRVHIGKKLQDWQNVTDFFQVPEIEINPENSWYTMTEDGSIYSGDGTVLLLCRDTAETVVIPEGVTTIGAKALKSMYGDAATMKTLSLPATLTRLPEKAFVNLSALESITVAPGNTAFAAWDGLLYTRDGKTLIACPAALTGTVTVRTGTEEIGPDALYGLYMKADAVVIPEGVTVIRSGNCGYLPTNAMLALYLPESLKDIHPDMLTRAEAEQVILYCPAGSEAERFGKSLGLTVVTTAANP